MLRPLAQFSIPGRGQNGPRQVEGNILNQVTTFWQALDMRRRVIVILSSAAMFAAILLLARMATSPSMSLLFSGLDPAIAGEVVSALDQRGVAYQVRGNAIYVDSTRRDELRMSLAQEGLPANTSKGYELLDNLSGFGTTARMFDAAYWRAKEGELARTILIWPNVRSVRVHIATPQRRPFAKRQKVTASVTLRLTASRLTDKQVRGLRFLVASAVAGLMPEDVAIIDADRGLIPVDGASPGAGRKAQELRRNIVQLLEARVGPGNAVVEVSVDLLRQQEKLVEKKFDPNSRVAISTDNREVSGNSTDSGRGQVTVASNLPANRPGNGGATSKSTRSETREIVNYEVSQTTRELIKHPGQIRKLSVAVLVNDVKTTNPDGTISWRPRSEQELTALRDLVQSAIGYDKSRGDVVTVRAMKFQPVPQNGTEAVPSLLSRLSLDATAIIKAGMLALVVLVLVLTVLRPLLARPPLVTGSDTANAEGAALPAPDAPQGAGTNALDHTPDPVAQLRQIIAERQDDAMEVLKSWIESDEEPA